MRVLDTRKGEALRAADACCEKRRKQVAEERVSERSVWESISEAKGFYGWSQETLILGLRLKVPHYSNRQ